MLTVSGFGNAVYKYGVRAKPCRIKKAWSRNVSRRNAENLLKIGLTAKTVRNKEKTRPKSAFLARESEKI